MGNPPHWLVTPSPNRVASPLEKEKLGERNKPPSVHPGIRLSVRVARFRGAFGLPATRTCTGGDSPFHRSSAVDSRSHRAICDFESHLPAVGPLRVHSPSSRSGSHASSVGPRRVVSVPEPAVSRSGFASGHPPERWGDFPREREPTSWEGSRWTADSSPSRPPRQPGSLSQ